MGVYYWVGTQGGWLRHFSPTNVTSAPTILTTNVVVLGAALTVASSQGASLTAGGLVNSLEMTAALLFVAAGLVGLARWRITSESPSALIGLALAVYGGLAVPVSSASGLVYDDGTRLHPVSGLLATIAAAVLIIAALQAPHAADRQKPVTFSTVMSPLVGIALLVLIGRVFAADAGLSPATHVVLELAALATWATLLTMYTIKARKLDERWVTTAAALMAGMVLVGLCRTVAIVEPGQWSFPAAALLFATAAMTLAVTLLDLRAGSRARVLNHRAVTRALARAEDVLAEQHEWRRHLAHDSRNAMAALRMAMTVLTYQGDRLSAEKADELRGSVMNEIGHLEHLLRRADSPAMEEFPIGDVLEPILVAQREGGLEIHSEIDDVAVRGFSADLGVVLGTLFSNLQPVPAGQHVSLTVEEDFPVVRVELSRHPVLPSRGRHAAACNGQSRSELGLYVATRLMANQNGTIAHREGPDGEMCYSLTLMAALPSADESSEVMR